MSALVTMLQAEFEINWPYNPTESAEEINMRNQCLYNISLIDDHFSQGLAGFRMGLEAIECIPGWAAEVGHGNVIPESIDKLQTLYSILQKTETYFANLPNSDWNGDEIIGTNAALSAAILAS